MPFQRVDEARLYYELRGDGPPLLLIMGATGYGAVFDRFAELLADSCTVVTYDVRGNGRSPRPPGWRATSPEEQADDAAGLLDTLGLLPAAVFGTSSGGVFALEMLVRHARSIQGVVLHEPALFALMDDPGHVRETLGAVIAEGMRAGGPATALERFVRFAAGDANWETLAPAVREGMLASADTYFGAESGAFDSYRADPEVLVSTGAPIELLVSTHSHPFFAEAAARLAHDLGVEVTPTPGTHFPYLDHPAHLAKIVKAFVRGLYS
jgi:pimeloyl-ACP methyl ester carboxylesterase